MTSIFKNRSEAGEKLAEKLEKYASEDTLVLALPRGGVPIGYEVAKKLKAPLDTLVVRKIGAPFNPEFGVGAIAPGDVIVMDNSAIHALGLGEKQLDPIITREMREMDRRLALYKSGEYSKNAVADTVIVVDDGIATGVTARAAIESIKLREMPERLIFAAPVCASDTAELIRNSVDALVCLLETEDLSAIGDWYIEFPQTTDREVLSMLKLANAARLGRNLEYANIDQGAA